MPQASLSKLPPEMLLRVGECLDYDHRPSLSGLARASKGIYSIIGGLLFRTIQFDVLSAQALAQDAQECASRLRLDGFLGQVRCLIVCGQAPLHVSEGLRGDLVSRKRWYAPKLSVAGREDDGGVPGLSERRLPFIRVSADDEEDNATTVSGVSNNWKPLASLIEEFAGLEFLIYRCRSQFPPCLLEVLHRRLPRCKLRIDAFRLRSLNDATTDEYELQLVTSPCLYSIILQYEDTVGYDDLGRATYQCEAAMRMVAGLAVNLKEVRMRRLVGNVELLREEFDPLPVRLPWRGFGTSPRSLPFAKGSLQRLELWSTSRLDQKLIEGWSGHTRFSFLRDLRLKSPVDMDVLTLLSTKCFSCLEALVLTLEDGRALNNLVEGQRSEYYEATSRFLQQLRRLSNLEVVGWDRQVSLGETANTNLSKLSLRPARGGSPESKDISCIAKQCPLLRDLTVTLRRSKGDSKEVAAYKTLGSLKKLKRLNLTLDASPPSPPFSQYQEGSDVDTVVDASFDEFDRQRLAHYPSYTKGHARDFFVNAAVDEPLARAIFRTISSAKALDSLPLERLRVSVFCGSFHPQPSLDFQRFTSNLARSWLVQRNPRDDSRDKVIVSELGRQEREQADGLERYRPQASELDSIFRRIWPAKGANGDWRNDWHSWQLEIED